jgi:hypothetical protein
MSRMMTTPLQQHARRISLASLAGMVLLLGCGKTTRERKPVFPVSGKVLFNGRPAAGALIAFHPAEELDNPRALRPIATVARDGTFRLTTYDTNDGAPAGEYVVTVYWPGPLPKHSPPGEVGPDQLGGRYATPRSPLCRMTIKECDNQLGPFQVKLASSAP